ncbi:MAG: SpoIIE family protein phosphatase [Desulfobacteraceae bacterium]|nr:SpoIIE family protein phosphatase [Desulfobacteraceae bacterium]
MTIVQMTIEYTHTKNDIRRELLEVRNVFSESLTAALWAENFTQVEALANGILRLPIATGIEIVKPKSNLAVKKFLTQKSDLFYQFNLIYMFEKNSLLLANITIYSDNLVVFNRVKLGFLLLFFSALIRSAILTGLFIWAVDKYLNQPLTAFIGHIEKINIEKSVISDFIMTGNSVELHQLNCVFHAMNNEITEYIENIIKIKEMYQDLFDHVNVGIFQVDFEGRLLTVNRAMSKIAGYAVEEEMMRSIGNLKELIKAPKYDSLMYEIKTSGTIRFETAIASKEGRTVICELSAYTPDRADGCFIEGMFEDLSDRRAKEKALREKEFLENEMELAKKIQSALLPDKHKLSGYDITASLEAADEVGGDYYDIISVGDYDWIIIGDVSGHGVTAGLIMMMVQTAIHTILIQNPGMPASYLLSAANKIIYENIEKIGEQKHITLIALAAGKDGIFSFSGLHEDILVWRTDIGKVDEIETNGMWIGLEPDISQMLSVETLRLKLGDCMVLFTDGITEAMDKNGKMFGNEGLIKIIEKNGDKPASEIHKSIMDAVEPYKKLDDTTLIVIKRFR